MLPASTVPKFNPEYEAAALIIAPELRSIEPEEPLLMVKVDESKTAPFRTMIFEPLPETVQAAPRVAV